MSPAAQAEDNSGAAAQAAALLIAAKSRQVMA
jgi:hypothetical protein